LPCTIGMIFIKRIGCGMSCKRSTPISLFLQDSYGKYRNLLLLLSLGKLSISIRHYFLDTEGKECMETTFIAPYSRIMKKKPELPYIMLTSIMTTDKLSLNLLPSWHPGK